MQTVASEKWQAAVTRDPGATSAQLGDVNTSYKFTNGTWLNLDGNNVIVAGGPPCGAHGDIVHPHTAWAALAASKVVSQM
jgi:hypothetical protein